MEDRGLERITRIMQSVHHLDVGAFDTSFLKTSIEKRCTFHPGETLGAYGDRLARDRAEAEALFASLRIGHSTFFRDPLGMALLQALVLPALLERNRREGRKEVRVWCAGCAAGQEAYSMAILLDDSAHASQGPVAYRIFATDFSEEMLAEGRAGRYPLEAVQNVPLKYVERYFTREGDCRQVIMRLKERVDFSLFDLVLDASACPPVSIFGDFDVALCSNILFYYRPEIRRMILEKLHECLAPGGYLVTGEAEKAIVERAGGFQWVAPPAAVFKKGLI